MIKINDYCINEDVNKNRIVISLPQTYSTLMDTVTPISNRKTKLSNYELAMLLNVVIEMYENKQEG